MDELLKLFEKKQRLLNQYKAVQMLNVSGKKSEERLAIDIAVETAKQEWLAAHFDYIKALEKYVKESRK